MCRRKYLSVSTVGLYLSVEKMPKELARRAVFTFRCRSFLVVVENFPQAGSQITAHSLNNIVIFKKKLTS
jgi:hypothetical protein